VLLVLGVLLLAVVAISVVRSRSALPIDGAKLDRASRKALEQRGVDPDSKLAYRHYLYFHSEAAASSAAAELKPEFEVEIQAPSDGMKDWAVLAQQVAALDEAALEALMARLTTVAQRWRGEYDGWEAATGNSAAQVLETVAGGCARCG